MLLQAFCIIRSHWWIQTGVTVGKRLIWVKIDDYFSRVTLIFDGWPSKTIGHLFYATSSFVQQGKSEGFDSCDRPSNLTQIGFESSIFQPVWPLNLMDDPKNNRAPLLYYIKLCASFQIHQWIQTGVTVRKRPIWVKIDNIFEPCDLAIWRMTLKNNRVPQGKSEGFDSCDRPSNLTQIGFESSIFQPVWPLNLMDDPEK